MRNPEGMRKGERGMITTEIALGTLLVAGIMALLSWALFMFVAADQCQLAADEVARQAARGDEGAVARASGGVPAGARVSVSHESGASVVVVSYDATLFGLPAGTFRARSTVLDEAKP